MAKRSKQNLEDRRGRSMSRTRPSNAGIAVCSQSKLTDTLCFFVKLANTQHTHTCVVNELDKKSRVLLESQCFAHSLAQSENGTKRNGNPFQFYKTYCHTHPHTHAHLPNQNFSCRPGNTIKVRLL